MDSQARHESVSPKETSASRYVVPQERVKPFAYGHVHTLGDVMHAYSR